MDVKSAGGGLRHLHARERADQKSKDTNEHDDVVDDEGGDDKEVCEDRPSFGAGSRRVSGGRDGGWRSSKLLQALVRGGGRLGWLEGVPFQTLRIDLFVDGPPSLHPLLVVVDHVLKLFQHPFTPPTPRPTFEMRSSTEIHNSDVGSEEETLRATN